MNLKYMDHHTKNAPNKELIRLLNQVKNQRRICLHLSQKTISPTSKARKERIKEKRYVGKPKL